MFMKLLFKLLVFSGVLFFSLSSYAENQISNYNISSKGIKIGVLVWKIKTNNNFYEISINLKSKGLLSPVFNFEGRYFAKGVVKNEKYSPIQYTHFWETKNKVKKMEIFFDENKLDDIVQKPNEVEHSRIDFKKILNYSDPLSSFLNLLSNKKKSKTIDGRRVYTMQESGSIADSSDRITITIEDYKNIWADHKRNDLKKIIFVKDSDGIFPKSIIIYFKDNKFKIVKK